MRREYGTFTAAVLILALALALGGSGEAAAQPSAVEAAGSEAISADTIALTLIGRVLTSQGQPIEDAEVRVFVGGEPAVLIVDEKEAESAHTRVDGYYLAGLILPADSLETESLGVQISKPGFRSVRQGFARDTIARADERSFVSVPDVVMPRVFHAAFFIASGIFVVVFILISLNLLHETIAAFLGAAAMLGVTYFLGNGNPDYWIIPFHRAIEFIDFDVIFLLMMMMIFMAVMSRTGVFQWLAYQTFRLARGNAFLVAAVLISMTGLVSSMLNDTTVMLLMAPVSIQIALALDIHPAALVVPEVLASNIGGAATLIGTPPNTIIGSYVGLGFNQFLLHMTPISLIAMLLLIWLSRRLYRSEFSRTYTAPSPALLARLEQGARITDRPLLKKSLIVFALTMILFFTEDLFQMPPAVVAILGSTVLLLWVRPNVGEMLREVDWTTLVFFMSLFMMVGGIQEVGLIQLIADGVRNIAGGNLLLATLLVIWVSAIFSAVVANIPFTAAIVPVTVFLSQTLPGAENNVLYWALALGAGLGGNATYIGSAPNIVAMGVLDRAGYRQTFGDYARIGVPVAFVTVLVPTIWILIRYFWLGF